MLFKNPLLNKSYGEFLGYKNFYMKKEALLKLSIFNFGICKLSYFKIKYS